MLSLEYQGTEDDLLDYWKKAENLAGGFIFPEEISTNYQVGLAYNNSLTHAIPIYVNMLLSSVLQNATGKVLEVYSQPLKNYNPIFNPNVNKQLIFLLVILVGLSVFASSVPVYSVNEKNGKAKQLQIINGTYPAIYWLSNFIWEYLLSVPVIVLAIAVGDVDTYSKHIANLFVILSLYFISAIGMAYAISYPFKSPFVAQGIVLFSQLAPSLGFVIAFLATFAALSVNTGLTAVTAMAQAFCALCPSFGVMWSFMIFINFLNLRTSFQDSGIWSMNQLGIAAVWLTAHATFWILLVLFLEYYPRWKGKWKRLSNGFSKVDIDMEDLEDEDVKRERSRVTASNYNKDNIAIIHLRKQWNKDLVAVHDLCLGIPNGVCFGLLGVNGAGKSTTISMLSGEISPTSGEAFLNGYNITTQLDEVQKSIGVCPQHDALSEHLTGREHLRLYGLLKGVSPHNIDDVVTELLDLLKIQQHADKMVDKYSGGTKRKLSLAIALIGNPSILFLDEPSTGMDPVSRHFMWRLIMEISKEKSIILTTHSMQECDAVCSNIGIMNQGRLKCLGSSQHLKNTYGNGYNLHLKLAKSDLMDAVVNFFTDNYKGVKILEVQERVVKLEIPMQNLSLSKLFKDLDEQQDNLGFEDYAVTQTTLEQIFLNMSAPKAESM